MTLCLFCKCIDRLMFQKVTLNLSRGAFVIPEAQGTLNEFRWTYCSFPASVYANLLPSLKSKNCFRLFTVPL